MKYKNLYLIGTSHIAKESINEITKSFYELNPDIVAVELDQKRLIALLMKSKDVKKIKKSYMNVFKIGLKGYLFSLLGEFVQKKLGEYAGIKPGSDMITAIKLARKEKKEIALIDQDIEITLKKLSKAISWKERFNFIADIIKSILPGKKKEISFNLEKVPPKELIAELMGIVKKRYPNIFRVLVTERNEIMSKKLAILMQKNPEKKILAVVGAGHEEEMLEIIKKKLNSIEVVYTNSFSID